MARKVSVVLLSLLCLFLVGTAVVLSTTKAYLKIEDWAYITEAEVPWDPTGSRANASRADEIVPRILHQTWKTDVLPEQWAGASQDCRNMHPDYEYMLWTDAKSRQLIAEHYPWFLSTFDGYKYKIQRADAIRYFVLHHFGGVYMDLDMACLRPMDPLLKFQAILPKTIPVGVSNDLMTSTPGHAFMEQVIRALVTFDINYVLNYPTVMFSTGPMFMSAQYGLYTASHPPTPQNPGGDVRILPKSLYGKNAKPGEAPHSFFEHFYGSSWHSDDAWLWTFLGVWGMRLMYVACIFAAIVGLKMYIFKKKGHGTGLRGRRLVFGRYEVLLPRFMYDRDTNTTQLDLGPFSMFAGGHSREVSGSSTALSPSSSEPTSPTATPRFPSSMIPFSVDVGPSSPTLSTSSSPETNTVTDAIRRAGSWVFGAITPLSGYASAGARRSNRSASRSSRRRRSRGILFFLPAIFHPASSNRSPEFEPISLPPIDSDAEAQTFIRRSAGSHSRSRSPIRKAEEAELEAVPLMGGKLAAPEVGPAGSRRSSMAFPSSGSEMPPPPYVSSRAVSPGAALTAAASSSTTTSQSWESWGERR